MDLNNRSLALILVAAITVSLFGTLVTLNKINSGLTGLATGQLNLSVTSTANCVVDSNITFGASGQPTGTYILSSDNNNSATSSFQDCDERSNTNNCKGLQINNTGNVDLNVTMNSNANASSLIVSQTNLDITDFRYFVTNGSNTGNASNGCRNSTNLTAQIERLPLNVIQSLEHHICRNLTYNDGTDVMHIDFNVTLEPDVYPGTKTAVLTITCQQV